MSTIANLEDAKQALCAGDFFQVGGKLINPSDIVRFERGEEPSFYLEDGTKVTHEPTTPGDVGDFLAEALEVATRVGQQSEILYPGVFAWNLSEFTTGPTRKLNNYVGGRERGMAFIGQNLYLGDEATNDVVQVQPGNEEDITNLAEDGSDEIGRASVTDVLSITVSPDEKILHVMGDGGDGFVVYDFGTAGDITSISKDQRISPFLNKSDVAFSKDGSRAVIAEMGDSNIRLFELSTPYDIRTRTEIDRGNIAALNDLGRVDGGNKNGNFVIAAWEQFGGGGFVLEIENDTISTATQTSSIGDVISNPEFPGAFNAGGTIGWQTGEDNDGDTAVAQVSIE
jgi:hypothetical protein